VRCLTRCWIVPSGGRGSEGGDLGAARLTWTGNREGTAAWRGSAGRSEGIEGVAVQGPRDTVKAILLEAYVSSDGIRTSCDTMPEVAATGIGRSGFCRLNPSGRWAAGSEPAQGDGRDAYVTLDTSNARGIRDGLRARALG
jgi:hypothetical protein